MEPITAALVLLRMSSISLTVSLKISTSTTISAMRSAPAIKAKKAIFTELSLLLTTGVSG